MARRSDAQCSRCGAEQLSKNDCGADLRSVKGRCSLLALTRASSKARLVSAMAPRIILDLCEAEEMCSTYRVERIMSLNMIIALQGYRTRHNCVGRPSVLVPDLAKRQFNAGSWAKDRLSRAM
jgi:hypothetical protein